MSERTVTNQAELDPALADKVDYVYIQSADIDGNVLAVEAVA
jgi:hypothetical protein